MFLEWSCGNIRCRNKIMCGKKKLKNNKNKAKGQHLFLFKLMFELWWVRFFLLWIGHPTQISWPLGTLREQTCWQRPHHSTKFQLKQTNHQSNPLAVSSLFYQIKLLGNQSSSRIHLQETFNLPITTNTHTEVSNKTNCFEIIMKHEMHQQVSIPPPFEFEFKKLFKIEFKIELVVHSNPSHINTFEWKEISAGVC